MTKIKKRDKAETVAEIIERNTGITTENFLYPKVNCYVKNIAEAAQYIKNFIKKEKNPVITIVGDFDCDGVMATAITEESLGEYPVSVHTRLPHRFSEGYGLSPKIIDEIDTGLVITVDNGISAYDAIRKAKEKGLAVIVIDHHLPPVDETGKMKLPPADIIVDPHIEQESEFSDYCGAALAYKLACALRPEDDLSELLVYASIATIADVMPLVGDNRNIVKEGLKRINQQGLSKGFSRLLTKLYLDFHISEDDYGFKIAPVVNACGRLYDDGAERILRLLIEDLSAEEIERLTDFYIETNNKRKEQVKEGLELVQDQIGKDKFPIIVYKEGLGEGIIGIIAGNICEKYKRPCIVFTDAAQDGVLKGSGRSISGIHLYDSLTRISDLMLGFGGHAGAAGLSIKKDNLEKFSEAFKEAIGEIHVDNTVYYDLQLTKSNMTSVLEDLKTFAPYGEGNPKPCIRMKYIVNGAYREIGDGTHFKISGKGISVFGFGLAKKYGKLGYPKSLDCIGYLGEDWYKGESYLKFELADFNV